MKIEVRELDNGLVRRLPVDDREQKEKIRALERCNLIFAASGPALFQPNSAR